MKERPKWTHIYFWKRYRPEIKNMLCRIIKTGKMNSIEIELENSERMITSRYAVRRR
jgi:hypothetical protein